MAAYLAQKTKKLSTEWCQYPQMMGNFLQFIIEEHIQANRDENSNL